MLLLPITGKVVTAGIVARETPEQAIFDDPKINAPFNRN